MDKHTFKVKTDAFVLAHRGKSTLSMDFKIGEKSYQYRGDAKGEEYIILPFLTDNKEMEIEDIPENMEIVYMRIYYNGFSLKEEEELR